MSATEKGHLTIVELIRTMNNHTSQRPKNKPFSKLSTSSKSIPTVPANSPQGNNLLYFDLVSCLKCDLLTVTKEEETASEMLNKEDIETHAISPHHQSPATKVAANNTNGLDHPWLFGTDIFEATIRQSLPNYLQGEQMIFNSYFQLLGKLHYEVYDAYTGQLAYQPKNLQLFLGLYHRIKQSFQRLVDIVTTTASDSSSPPQEVLGDNMMMQYQMKYILLSFYAQSILFPSSEILLPHQGKKKQYHHAVTAVEEEAEEVWHGEIFSSTSLHQHSHDMHIQLYLEDILHHDAGYLSITSDTLWLFVSIGLYPIFTQYATAVQQVDCKALAYYLMIRYFLSSSIVRSLRMKYLLAFKEYVVQKKADEVEEEEGMSKVLLEILQQQQSQPSSLFFAADSNNGFHE